VRIGSFKGHDLRAHRAGHHHRSSTVATPPLDADGTAFSATVDQPGFYRADLPEDQNALTPLANPGIYGGRSPEVRVVG
jgi:hypothetical protein